MRVSSPFSEEDGELADCTADLEKDLIVQLGGSVLVNIIATHSAADSEQAPCVLLRGPAFLMMLVFNFAHSTTRRAFAFHCAGQHF